MELTAELNGERGLLEVPLDATCADLHEICAEYAGTVLTDVSVEMCREFLSAVLESGATIEAGDDTLLADTNLSCGDVVALSVEGSTSKVAELQLKQRGVEPDLPSYEYAMREALRNNDMDTVQLIYDADVPFSREETQYMLYSAGGHIATLRFLTEAYTFTPEELKAACCYFLTPTVLDYALTHLLVLSEEEKQGLRFDLLIHFTSRAGNERMVTWLMLQGTGNGGTKSLLPSMHESYFAMFSGWEHLSLRLFAWGMRLPAGPPGVTKQHLLGLKGLHEAAFLADFNRDHAGVVGAAELEEDISLSWQHQVRKVDLLPQRTLLHAAVIARCSETLALVLRWGAPVNFVDSDGCTAALHAATHKQWHDVRSLAAHGADLLIEDVRGISAAHLLKLHELTPTGRRPDTSSLDATGLGDDCGYDRLYYTGRAKGGKGGRAKPVDVQKQVQARTAKHKGKLTSKRMSGRRDTKGREVCPLQC